MQTIIDVLILIGLIIYYVRVNKAIDAAIKCEEHTRLLAYQGTKRDRQEYQQDPQSS